MGLYLLGRLFSFQPNFPNLTPSSAYSGSSYSGFYLRIVHLLPRFYMSTFSSILSPLKVILTIATIDTASSLQDSSYIKAAVFTVLGLITYKATSKDSRHGSVDS